MLYRSIRLTFAAALAFAICASPAPAGAQQQEQQQPTEFQSWHIPGWTFTPGVTLGVLNDTNVALASVAPPLKPASDQLFQFDPFGQLEYYSPRTTLSSGYRGSLRRYVELDELNSVDHRAFLSLRERINRRVTLFVRENYAQVPTTDRLELNGVPFQRGGARYNDIAGGVEARLTKSTDFTARYDLTWVDFVRKDTSLTGGVVNGVRSSLSQRLSERVSLGGEYEFRWADLNNGTRQQFFQNAGGVVRYRAAETTDLEAAAGVAHLDDRTRGVTRNGPYVRAEITHRARRATIGGEFSRSYVPSVAFGGTNQTEEAHGYVQMPLNHNRLYLQESATWHRTTPFDPVVLPLQSVWLNTVVGYALQRWVRIEGYYSLTHQDTRLAGGKIGRHVVGIQFAISEPMRIR